LLLASRAAFETKDRDPRGLDLDWPNGRNEARCHRNFLQPVGRIGDHAAGDCAADLLSPQPLAIGGVVRVEVSADVAEK
jgi:hypothetical protein